MELKEVLYKISRQGIKVWTDNGELKIKAPKSELTAELRELLSQNKAQLLHFLKKKSNKFTVTSIPLVPVFRNKNIPVSYQQERFWTISQLIPNSAVLNLSTAVQIKGIIKVPVLQQSWTELVRRHESLRTTFTYIDGELIQSLLPSLDIQIAVDEYRGLSAAQKATVIEKVMEQESQKSFDLSQAPLFRTKLLQFSDTEAALILAVHHIIIDALSLNLLFQELLSLYDAALENKQSSLLELAIQYADYAVWQRQLLQGEILQNGLEYWREQLAGVSTLYPVPADKLKIAQDFQRGQKNFQVSTATWSAIEQLSKQYGITPVVVFLAGFYLLIAQYSQQQDITVGFPVSGRNHPQLEAAIGLFTDTIILREKITDTLTLKELLYQIKETNFNAYAHQHIPLNYLINFIQHHPQQKYRNLFQLLFDYVDLGEKVEAKSTSTLTVTKELTRANTDIDLTFILKRSGQSIEGLFNYNLDLFEEETIAGLIESYLLILEQCIKTPETQINAFKLSDKLEVHKAAIHSHSRKKAWVEAALASIPEVEDCILLKRDNKQVAYVVIPNTFSVDKIHSHLQLHLSPELLPHTYVPISALPRTASGQVDEAILASLEVIDSDLITRWEEKLRSHPQIEQAAVVVQPRKIKATPLVHILDLVPETAIAGISSEETRQEAEPTPNPSLEGNRRQEGREFEGRKETIVPAFSDGGSLTIPEDAPLTLTEALIQTATRYQNKEIVYILGDKQQVSQTYSSLLSEAKCILNGLQAQGLQAGDKIILQIECLRDYFPALWGCILGGIQPVTVAVAKTYQQPNAVVKKLYNTWELLEHPPILASKSLLEPLQNLQQLLPFSSVQVLPVQKMKSYPATAEIYSSQPDDIAFLQLTSGSTGVPKCIQETHQGIVTHIHAAQQFNDYQSEDVSLNWLPVDHVVPILTCHFKDTYLGCQQIEVATDVVLANPTVWLDLMEQYRVSQTWTPNFGFKLVSDALSKVPHLSWDLSSVKFFMNAGEQVTPKVVREFLKLVAPFGVVSQAMQPAFGMAEVCTCMTYQNQFEPESGIHRIRKSSLGGQLVKGLVTETDIIEFTDLGAPVPGVQIRITDENNQLLLEGVIGRFQIKGKVVTPGYLHNPQANSEAFVGDGWFNSGDLGFILDGKLVLTGREKELIIINGVNYYCYEIEDTVNNLEGVEPTFAGAVSFSQPETGTEGLAIFFVPKQQPLESNLELIKTIRQEVSSQLGITPTYVIPLSGTEFPKTTSGKIQRGRLKRMLEAGECQEVIKAIDIQLVNNRTIPNWFYQKHWQIKEISAAPAPQQVGLTLILVDRLGLGCCLSEKLEELGQYYIQVDFGNDFAQLSDNNYIIAPGDRQHYRELLESISANKTPISRILHLGTYQDYTEADVESLEQAQNQGLYSLLHLVQALEAVQGTQHQVQLLFVSSYTQLVQPTDNIAYEKATVLGLLKTIPQEMPWLSCTHIDLRVAEVEGNGNYIWQELCSITNEPEIVYRDGKRLVSGLKSVNLASEPQQGLPFKRGGIYLLSGGLGGVGKEVAKYLLEHYQAKLILVGRTPLPEKSTWKNILQKRNEVAEKIQTYQQLQQLGTVRYQASDICNLSQLQQVVAEALSEWDGKLDGIIHLAGLFQERLLVSETQNNIATLLRPKVLGTLVLHQLLQDNTDGLFIHFASINGFFGGVNVGTYAVANSFQTAFCDYQRAHTHLQSYCLAWSMWDEVGMSRGYQMKELSRAKGYYAITPSQGIYSLLAALSHKHHNLLVGLDSSKPQIQHLSGDCQSLQQLVAYFSAQTTEFPIRQLQELDMRDCFGTPSKIQHSAFVQLESLPITPDGKVDYNQLRSSNKHTASQSRREKNETEQNIAVIWQEVLKIAEVGIDDNFFYLGGNSLLAIQLMHKIEQKFRNSLPLSTLFQSPTVEQLATLILQKSISTFSPLFPINPNGSKVPIFCVHPGSGTSFCYFELAQLLGTEQPFYGLQALGTEKGQKPLTRVEDMATFYLSAIREVQPKGPYILLGWSFGGVVALQMAHELTTQGEQVGFLGLLDTYAPSHLPDEQNLLEGKEIVLQLFGGTVSLPSEEFQKLTPKEQAVFILEQARQTNVIPPNFEVSDIERLLEVLRLNMEAMRSYSPPSYPNSITLFRAEKGSLGLSQEIVSVMEPTLGWENERIADLELQTVPGYHEYMIYQPSVTILAQKLQACLEKSLGTC
ncbi:MAG: AMP-binding protein [Symploca sp. SIO3E6]|nr:AMP-binding protein [Caldora sp. SIO3E6]